MKKLTNILESLLDDDFDISGATALAQALYNAMCGTDIDVEVPELMKGYEEFSPMKQTKYAWENPYIRLNSYHQVSITGTDWSNYSLSFIQKVGHHYKTVTLTHKSDSCLITKSNIIIKNQRNKAPEMIYRCWSVPQDQFDAILEYYEKIK